MVGYLERAQVEIHLLPRRRQQFFCHSHLGFDGGRRSLNHDHASRLNAFGSQYAELLGIVGAGEQNVPSDTDIARNVQRRLGTSRANSDGIVNDEVAVLFQNGPGPRCPLMPVAQ